MKVLTNEEDCSTYNLCIKKKIAITRNIEALRAQKFKLELVIPIGFIVSVALDIATIMIWGHGKNQLYILSLLKVMNLRSFQLLRNTKVHYYVKGTKLQQVG